MFKPTDEQRSIIEGTESAIINAGPGTGKSATAIELARTVAVGLNPPQKVLFLSFSNAAIGRLAASAGISLKSVQSSLVFMTYHSLAWEIVRTYGRLWGLSNRLSVLDEVETLLAVANGDLPSIRDNSFDDLLRIAKKAHRVSFDIMVPLAKKILTAAPEICKIESKRFPLIIVDEFQDTRPDQWAFLKLIGTSSRVLALGDLNQVIYGNAYAEASKLFDDFKEWKGVEYAPFSRQSFRCKNNDILNFAYPLVNSQEADMTSTTVQVSSGHRTQFRAKVATHCASVLKTAIDHQKTIGILTSSALSAQKLAVDLKRVPKGSTIQIPIYAKVPVSEGKKESFRMAALAIYQLKMSKSESCMSNGIRALAALRTNWSIKAPKSQRIAEIKKELERPRNSKSKKPLFDLINLDGPMTFKEFEPFFLAALQESKFFSSVGKNIGSLGRSLVNFESEASSQMEFPFEHFRENRVPKGLYGDPVYRDTIEILSMWRSKGREFDYVIIVFDPRDLSAKVSLDTERRLFYVACTRAKEWLGIIYPHKSPGVALARTLGLS